MDRATLEFDFSGEDKIYKQQRFMRMLSTEDLYGAIYDFQQELRRVWKHGEERLEVEQAERWRDVLNGLLTERDIIIE